MERIKIGFKCWLLYSIGHRYSEQTRNNTQPQQQTTMRGRAYYEALCMRAVNQSVGRAIRHAGDYAAIIFAELDTHHPGRRRALPRVSPRSSRDGGGNVHSPQRSEARRRLHSTLFRTPLATNVRTGIIHVYDVSVKPQGERIQQYTNERVDRPDLNCVPGTL